MPRDAVRAVDACRPYFDVQSTGGLVDPKRGASRQPAIGQIRDNRGVDALTLVLILVAYFVLQSWLLPKLGVPT